jgi:hypothetical protein
VTDVSSFFIVLGSFDARLSFFTPIFTLPSTARAIVVVPLLTNDTQVISFGALFFGSIFFLVNRRIILTRVSCAVSLTKLIFVVDKANHIEVSRVCPHLFHLV